MDNSEKEKLQHYSPTRSEDIKEPKISGTDDIIELKQTLGLIPAVALIMGGMIGSGIFVSPKGVLQEIGSTGGALVVWVVCGLISCIGATCYAELGTCILKSGGDYAYIKEAYGGLAGFLFLWVAVVIINPTGNAISSLTFAYYILQPVFPNCNPPSLAIRFIAILTLTGLTFVNCVNVNWALKLQNLFTFLKLSALAIIILIGLYFLVIEQKHHMHNMFEDTTKHPSGIALSVYSALFSYSGWNFLNFVTEEIKNPFKNLPRAIWLSIPLITLIYTLTNLAYFTILSPAEVLNSNAVAVTLAQKTMGPAALLMPIFVAASTFGALSCTLFATSRVVFVGAREGLLPDFCALISIKVFSPITALILSCVLSCMMMVTDDLYTLINFTSFAETLLTGLSISGLLYMRWSKPNLPRPIKVSLFFPIIFMLVVVFLIICPLIYEPKNCIIALIMMFAGIPVHLICISWKGKPKIISKFTKMLRLFFQKLFIAMPQDMKS